MDANIAFAPIQGLNSLYSVPGVDFFLDPDLAAGRPTEGLAEFVRWVEYEGGHSFGEQEADEILAENGYRRTSDWDRTVPDYAAASIEKL